MSNQTNSTRSGEQDFWFLDKYPKEIDLDGLILTASDGALFGDGVELGNTALWSNYPVLPADDTNRTIFFGLDRLRDIGGYLYWNDNLLAEAGVVPDVGDWSLYPALQDVDLVSYGLNFNGHILTADTTKLYFNGTDVVLAWASRPALEDVYMNSHHIQDCTDVNCINVISQDVLTIDGKTQALIKSQDAVNLICGELLSDPENVNTMNLITQYGEKTEINITAGGGTPLAGAGGTIRITAQAGSIGTAVGVGGSIELLALSSAADTSLTSKISMNAASIISSAGALPTIGSVAGYNYIFGNAGVNIMCDIIGSVIPNFLGTVYIYGRNGVAIPGNGGLTPPDGGLFVTHIFPYSNGISRPDLIVSGLYNAKVRLQDVSEFSGSGCTMNGISSLSSTTTDSGTLSVRTTLSIGLGLTDTGIINMGGTSLTPSQINLGTTGSITGVTSINGAPYTVGAEWSTYPANGDVDMATHDITNCTTISTANVDLGGLVLTPNGDSSRIQTVNGECAYISDRPQIFRVPAFLTVTLDDSMYGSTYIMYTATPTTFVFFQGTVSPDFYINVKNGSFSTGGGSDLIVKINNVVVNSPNPTLYMATPSTSSNMCVLTYADVSNGWYLF